MVAGNIIFDLDGTLWDSSETVAASWSETVRLSGIPLLRSASFTAEDLRSVMGMTMTDIADKLFPDLSPTRRAELMDRCSQDENNFIAVNGGILYENEEEVLSELSHDKRLFIVSNCQCGYIEAYLEYTGFEKYFSDYLCWGDTGKGKAENIRLLIEKNKCINSVYVGDTRGDYASAEQAGTPFIHAAYGFGTLRASDKPAAVISGLKDLAKVLSDE